MTGKRSIGRPRKAPEEARTERLSGIRLTMAERARIEALAAAAGLDVAEFCRRALLGQRITPWGDRAAAATLLSEVNRIGTNLNQIARAMNAGRPLPSSLELATNEVRALVAHLLEVAE